MENKVVKYHILEKFQWKRPGEIEEDIIDKLIQEIFSAAWGHKSPVWKVPQGTSKKNENRANTRYLILNCQNIQNKEMMLSACGVKE